MNHLAQANQRPRDRRTQPSRQRIYIRLYARVDRLEDTISHFYNVINELRERVSTLEKKLKPLAKDDWINGIVLADDRVSDADRHEDISRAVAFSAGGDGGGRSPEHRAQFAHVVCGSQRLPNNRD